MLYKLIGEIIKIKGKCVAGFKVGDKIDLTIPYTEGEVKKMDKKKQKHRGVKHKIHEEKEREERIGLTITAPFELPSFQFSGIFINSILTSPHKAAFFV